MIAAQARGLVDLTVRPSAVIEVALATGHEERKPLVERIQTTEVDVAAIHNIERPRLQKQIVEDVDIVRLSVRNADKAGNTAAQVHECV